MSQTLSRKSTSVAQASDRLQWTFDRMPSDLSGRIYIITGANSGIGRVTALELARRKAHVILACRSESKAMPVVESIRKETGNSKVEFKALNLMSLESVDAFANDYLASHTELHGLILNAGIMAVPFALSEDGIESQFATNFLAHFHLTQKLLPVLEAVQPSSRVVVVSSIVHYLAPLKGVRFDKLNDKRSYQPFQAYGQSKLCGILFAKELARRLQERGVKNVYVNSVHPGVIHQTNLLHHYDHSLFGSVLDVVIKLTQKLISEEEGACTSLYVATDPEIETKNFRGEFFIPIAKLSKPVTRQGINMVLAKQLYEFAEKLIAEKLAAQPTDARESTGEAGETVTAAAVAVEPETGASTAAAAAAAEEPISGEDAKIEDAPESKQKETPADELASSTSAVEPKPETSEVVPASC